MKFAGSFKNWFFSKIHGNKLIYNTCWEDPRCDRMLLDFQEDSKIVMITSAGCNALEYLLDDPAEIHCIDMNYRQNALLELKKSCLKNLVYDDFFSLFGNGFSSDAKTLYQQKLKSGLSPVSQKYWDNYIKYFNGKGLRRSFYYRGTSGLLAFGFTHILKFKKQVRDNVNYLFKANSLNEQQQYFSVLERIIFNPFVKALLNNHYTMTLAGVPQNQQILIEQNYVGGTMEYIQECFRKIFTTIDVSDNYFYQLYFNGRYAPDCCPEYLRKDNFENLRSKVDSIRTYNTTVSDYLVDNPGLYSHFILLDHQDWLASNCPEELEREWKLILKNSKPGTKIILRSAAKEIDFFPDFVLKQVDFDQQKTKAIHDLDRVGTYASVYLGIVK